MSNSYSPQRFSILPPVIKNLLIINGLFFLAMIAFDSAWGIDLTNILGLHYPSASAFMPYQFFTYMFMHGGFTHLFFNMFALWMFGAALENYWGPKRFLFFYFFTGVGAALTHYLIFYWQVSPVMNGIEQFLQHPSNESFVSFINNHELFQVRSEEILNHFQAFAKKYDKIAATNPQQALSMAIDYMYQYKEDFLNYPIVVGASGAVFGVLLAFGMTFPNTLLYIYFIIPIKAKYFVLIYGAIELFSGVMDSAGDNVAHFAHLGGMVFGFLLLFWWEQEAKRKKRW